MDHKNTARLGIMKKTAIAFAIALLLILLSFGYLMFQYAYMKKVEGHEVVIAYSLLGMLTITIVIFFYRIRKDILLPYRQFYKRIEDVGLDNYLISLIENINNSSSFMEILQYINKTFSGFIPYNYIGIALIDEKQEHLKASYGVSDGTIIGMPDKIMGVSWRISDTSMEKLLRTGEGRIINDLQAYCDGRPLKPYNKVILDSGIRASITLPLTASGQAVGIIFFSSSSKNVYTKEHLTFLKALANSIAISLDQNIFIDDIRYGSVLALAKLAETRDEETGEHLERMATYTRAIAELLYARNIYRDQLTLEYIDQLERFSPLHDIGKVGISDSILLKPGKLTPEEFNEMKKHTTFGAEVLRSAEQNMQKKGKDMFRMGVEIAESHHERWDGTGYPYGRKGLEIPLSARIVALADVFDALVSVRPYKKAFSLEVAFEIIAEGRGKHFDPIIIDLFLENKKKFEVLYYENNKIEKIS